MKRIAITEEAYSLLKECISKEKKPVNEAMSEAIIDAIDAKNINNKLGHKVVAEILATKAVAHVYKIGESKIEDEITSAIREVQSGISNKEKKK